MGHLKEETADQGEDHLSGGEQQMDGEQRITVKAASLFCPFFIQFNFFIITLKYCKPSSLCLRQPLLSLRYYSLSYYIKD